jgi:hypothetical protein
VAPSNSPFHQDLNVTTTWSLSDIDNFLNSKFLFSGMRIDFSHIRPLSAHKTPSTMTDEGAPERHFQSFTSVKELAEHLQVPEESLYCVEIKKGTI